jgi:hypothetical protein
MKSNCHMLPVRIATVQVTDQFLERWWILRRIDAQDTKQLFSLRLKTACRNFLRVLGAVA